MGEAFAVTPADIDAAAERICGAVVHTPTVRSETLSLITGADVVLKFENLQFTASFKDRGAANKLAQLTDDERRRGVVAMSAGNHAQALAHHATRLAIPSVIVMPMTTPNVKVVNTEKLGARVVLYGHDLTEAATRARELVASEGLVWVPPYDDPAIIAGQGTTALELLEDAPDTEIVVVPVGGGGLIAGMAVAAKARRPDLEIIGVEAELFPSMRNALGYPVAPVGGSTVAEGIAVPTAGELTVPIVRALVTDVVTVNEARIEEAVGLLLEIEKTVTEGAGATGLAALLDAPERYQGRRVAVILSGGNVDPRILAQIIMRGLVHSGRLSRISVDITDVPGALARVSTIIGEHGGNIIEVAHQRTFNDLSIKAAVLEFMVETRDRNHVDQIVAALGREGYHVTLGVHS
jgi:threonine dehydratase